MSQFPSSNLSINYLLSFFENMIYLAIIEVEYFSVVELKYEP